MWDAGRTKLPAAPRAHSNELPFIRGYSPDAYDLPRCVFDVACHDVVLTRIPVAPRRRCPPAPLPRCAVAVPGRAVPLGAVSCRGVAVWVPWDCRVVLVPRLGLLWSCFPGLAGSSPAVPSLGCPCRAVSLWPVHNCYATSQDAGRLSGSLRLTREGAEGRHEGVCRSVRTWLCFHSLSRSCRRSPLSDRAVGARRGRCVAQCRAGPRVPLFVLIFGLVCSGPRAVCSGMLPCSGDVAGGPGMRVLSLL